MRVRIYMHDPEPEHTEIPIPQLQAYIDFLKCHTIEDAEGRYYTINMISYDAHQHAVDIMCQLDEEDDTQK